MFVGGSSALGEDVWKNNNGSTIVNENYPPGNQSVCQQMTWPLTYSDGVNLRPKQCVHKAFFLCQTKCESKKEIKTKIKQLPINFLFTIEGGTKQSLVHEK